MRQLGRVVSLSVMLSTAGACAGGDGAADGTDESTTTSSAEDLEAFCQAMQVIDAAPFTRADGEGERATPEQLAASIEYVAPIYEEITQTAPREVSDDVAELAEAFAVMRELYERNGFDDLAPFLEGATFAEARAAETLAAPNEPATDLHGFIVDNCAFEPGPPPAFSSMLEDQL